MMTLRNHFVCIQCYLRRYQVTEHTISKSLNILLKPSQGSFLDLSIRRPGVVYNDCPY
jgi:hypothetical protein